MTRLDVTCKTVFCSLVFHWGQPAPFSCVCHTKAVCFVCLKKERFSYKCNQAESVNVSLNANVRGVQMFVIWQRLRLM